MTQDPPKTKVLFVCTGNACRSQMAEGWTRARWGDRIEVHSAGVMPCGVSALAAKVMKEEGVDLSTHTSKHVLDLADVAFDYVITVCDSAATVCPRVPGEGKRLHRGFRDPPTLARFSKSEEEELVHYRRIRDEIRDFVETLPDFLAKAESA
jgi:arsenate reductase (thioredoxin)